MVPPIEAAWDAPMREYCAPVRPTSCEVSRRVYCPPETVEFREAKTALCTPLTAVYSVPSTATPMAFVEVWWMLPSTTESWTFV
jgi:hypothetical protein